MYVGAAEVSGTPLPAEEFGKLWEGITPREREHFLDEFRQGNTVLTQEFLAEEADDIAQGRLTDESFDPELRGEVRELFRKHDFRTS
ncbi:MAG: hypothetical protein U0797_00760 [Gemmataceae bacterium]